MKKIIIVNNNMKVGGVQKSLCNLLHELDQLGSYEVTLVLFSPVGDYMDQIPAGIRCIYPKSLFRYLGICQAETTGVDAIKRGVLAGICRTIGRNAAMKIILASQSVMEEEYDCAIAFLHNGKKRSFFGGVQDFVLHCVKAKRKVTCLHDDYDKCGANHQLNNVIMDQFDAIMPCSDGCRRVFESALPNLAYKTATVRNCNNITEIRTMAEMDSIAYDDSDINVLCAARFSPRKGIDRAIEAAYYMHEKGLPIKLHILGSGVMENELKEMARTRNMESYVTFYGEQANPYRFMKNADLFMLTSYHEAAPMVIDEAYILGVPVLTTRTNSSDEMVTDRVCGWVCENNQDSLNEMLYSIICDKHALREQKKELRMRQVDNAKAMEQFVEMIEG